MRAKPKNTVEQNKMRAACKLASHVLDHLTPFVKEGTNTQELNDLADTFMKENGAISATLGYRGYPRSICTSINDVVCHGIPSYDEILKNGDIMNIDVTVILDGFYGDTSRMFMVGSVSQEAQQLIKITKKAMEAGIATVKSGSWLSDISKAIQTIADNHGYGVVRDYVGHGIGRNFHEMPQVCHHFPHPGMPDMRLRKGMTFTIEPMLNLGTWEVRNDGR